MIRFAFSLLLVTYSFCQLWANHPLCLTSEDTPIAQFAVDNPQGCIPLSVQFFDNSQNATTYNWTFENGTPATSTLAEPTVTFNTIGRNLATMIVSNDMGSDTFSFEIKVKNPPPHAAFNFQLTGMQATFTNNSSGADHYLWDFGDGNTSNEENPIHTYKNEKTYLVRLIAANDCTTDDHADAVVLTSGQVIPNYTANDIIPSYDEPFLPGVNLGFFPPWQDINLANIAAGNPEEGIEGFGIKTIRPLLSEDFLETWGYDIRLREFQHYTDIKLKDNTVIVGFPSNEHRDPNFYCEDHQSEMFANLYTDIWDNGENGTPVNDSNYLALYLYRMVNLYKGNVKFWEIWNEPGFDYTFTTGFLPPGAEGSWWDNNPDPCDYKLRAPIFHYVRTLRVAYEVIKYIDPDAYVTLASVGYQSFLDAVLRNTDNPIDGSPSSDYPLGGGAYFDVITMHSYPHFDGTLRYWDQNTMSFVHSRHSDKAASGIERTKSLYQQTLASHGYDGNTFPEKEWIITEINIPRKEFGDFIGGEDVQINYIIKAYIEAVKNNILTMHIYDMAESHYLEDAVNEFQLMGLFQRLFEVFPYDHTPNLEAIAHKTTSDLLYTSAFDAERTAALAFPQGVTGAAFLDRNGKYTYALWAETHSDRSEDVSATYTFPQALNITQLEKRKWDFGRTKEMELVSGNSIELNARPVFFTDQNNVQPIAPTAKFEVAEVQGCTPMQVDFVDQSSTNVTNWNWTFEGGTPATSTEQNPSITFNTPGTYEVTLEVSNANGSHITTKSSYIIADEVLPVANFEVTIVDQVATFNNQSQHATSYFWDLADGNKSTAANPANDYSIPAFYEIMLVATNGCGSDTSFQTIIISPNEVLPQTAFSATQTNGCAPFTVQYNDLSSENATEWFWNFDGGSPSISSEQNPTVVYENPGEYWVKLTSSNDAGSDSKFKAAYITVQAEMPTANFEIQSNDPEIVFTNNSVNAESYVWNFGDGNNSTELSPTHVYTNSGLFTAQLIAFNVCGTDTMTQTVMIETISNTELPSFLQELQLFPNPNKGQFVLNLRGHSETVLNIRIINILGEEVLKEVHPFQSGQLNRTFDLKHLSSGTYLLWIDNEKGFTHRKIIIE